MILVNGRSVVSVWKTLPSTCPLRIADFRSLIGNSGLVTAVGSENGAATRSRRAESGARGRSPRPAASSCAWVGCGTAVEAEGWHPVVAAVAAAGWLRATPKTLGIDSDTRAAAATALVATPFLNVRFTWGSLRLRSRSGSVVRGHPE